VTGDSSSRRLDPLQVLSVGTVEADRDAFVANVIHVYYGLKEAPPQTWEAPRDSSGQGKTPEVDPGPEVKQAASALALLKQVETCIYLGCRYGLTPQSPVSPELLGSFPLGVKPPTVDSLSAAMSWLAGKVGMMAARRHLADHYASLDEVGSEVVPELNDLAAVAAGRTFVTGSYSARIQNALGPALTIVHDDKQLGHGLSHGRSQRAHLLRLHGSEQDFQNALVSKDNVLTYSEHRPALAKAVSDLLLYPWIILGAEEKADSTFHLLVSNVSRKLEMQQRPLFVIDPRPEDEVVNEWPRPALRHIRLTPAEFLSMARRVE